MEASPDDCTTSADSLYDLAAIRVYGTRRGTTEEPLLYTEDAVGKEGQPLVLTFSLPDHPLEPWTLRVVAVDDSGNESCPKYIGVNLTTDVPPTDPLADVVWYDVLGRKYRQKPKTPGIYIEVRGNARHKTVILR